MLTAGGAKLLDFGLAKPKQQAQASPSGSPISAGPISTTAPGTILGTMQYMAPEQLDGQEADARTDIFAFGAVLYEMVTGRKAFEGKNQPHLIAAIVSAQPDPISKTQPTAPAALDFLVERCLAKDPDERLQTATDLVSKLRWIAEGGGEGGAPIGVQRRRRATVAQLALVAVTLLVAAMSVRVVMSARGTDERPTNRFLIEVPDMPAAEAVSISPDGLLVAYSASGGGAAAVFVRPLNTNVGTKLAGTEGAGRLFWSPDSRWIAFFADGKLKKIAAEGGSVQNICDTPDLQGGTWNADGVIVFGSSKGLQRVLAAGGQPSPIAAATASQEQRPQEPYFLPDGRHYLYLAGSAGAAGGAGSDAAIYAGSLDSTNATRIVAAQSNAVYAEPGYLLFHREGTLYAQAFDAKGLNLSGEAVRLADKIPYATDGAAAFAASHTGVLIYRNDPPRQAVGGALTPGGGEPRRSAAPLGRPGRHERTGRRARRMGGRRSLARRQAGGGASSRRGRRRRVDLRRRTEHTVEVHLRRRAGQLVAGLVARRHAHRVQFAAERQMGTLRKARRQHARGRAGDRIGTSCDADELVGRPAGVLDSRSEDVRRHLERGDCGDKKPVPIVQTRADERNPQVSADGKWIAYSSNESGRSEIYIRPFPEGPGRIQVSVNGGVFPRWRRDGRELYFMSLVSLGVDDGVRDSRERRVGPAGGASDSVPVGVPGRHPRGRATPRVRRVAGRPAIPDSPVRKRGRGVRPRRRGRFQRGDRLRPRGRHGGPPRRDGSQLLVHGPHHRGAQLDADDEATEIGSLCPSSPAHVLVPSKSSRR